MIAYLDESQQRFLKYWLPAVANGGAAWLLLLFLGSTPLVRASGLALVIVGVTLALRRMGAAVAVIGGLSLTLSPVFWSQTGGAEGQPATIVIAIIAASATVLLVALLGKRPYLAFGLGILVFVGLFWSQIGTPRSIRLTAFVVGWLMFLLIDMLLLTNPRPDEAPLLLMNAPNKRPDGSVPARNYHTMGILLLLGVGILNDPVLTFLVPAVALSLFLTRTKLPPWYWLGLGLALAVGVRGLAVDYLQNQAHLMILDEWRSADRWIDMVRLVSAQFGVVGLVLSILGLARLSRWYPPLGTVSLLAYGAYWFFGLVYVGSNRDVLLLPMIVIQVVWMTYAVLAFSEWAAKSTATRPHLGRYAVIVAYGLLPLLLLWTIVAP